MSDRDAIWQSFQLDGNRLDVSDENRARLYLAQLAVALRGLRATLARGAGITRPETLGVEPLVRTLCATFNLLALRHWYARPEAPLRIDPTDSGFFHASELLELEADLERRAARLAELPARDALKREMLARIVDHGLRPRDLQQLLLERRYLEELAPEKLFGFFLPGALQPASGASGAPSYLWPFATYDRALNRPFFSLVCFTHTGRTFGARQTRRLLEVSARTATGRAPLLAVMREFAEQLPEVQPRIVRRLCVGPFVSPLFTRGGGELDRLLAPCAERLPWLLHVEIETLISEGEQRVRRGWLGGEELRQIFWIPKSLDLAARGASQLQRLALLPHWLAQQLADCPVLAQHQILSVDQSENIHGLD